MSTPSTTVPSLDRPLQIRVDMEYEKVRGEELVQKSDEPTPADKNVTSNAPTPPGLPTPSGPATPSGPPSPEDRPQQITVDKEPKEETGEELFKKSDEETASTSCSPLLMYRNNVSAVPTSSAPSPPEDSPQRVTVASSTSGKKTFY